MSAQLEIHCITFCFPGFYVIMFFVVFLLTLCSNVFGQVAFHIQPYKGRTDQSMHDNIKYIIDKYVVFLMPLNSSVPDYEASRSGET